MANYGEKTKLEVGKPIQFPDFTIEFLGRREGPIKVDFSHPQD